MEIAVWDTYVDRKDGLKMHFDILVPNALKDKDQILAFGKQYLKAKPFVEGELQARECLFCHIEKATEKVLSDIDAQGFSIIEMENCY